MGFDTVGQKATGKQVVEASITKVLIETCEKFPEKDICTQLKASFKANVGKRLIKIRKLMQSPERVFRHLREHCGPEKESPACKLSYMLLIKSIRISKEKGFLVN